MANEKAALALAAQIRYCVTKGIPCFVDTGGRCIRCGKDIFAGESGYTEEYASTHQITGCPYCNRSFVE